MNQRDQEQTVVVALGNLIRSDDGVGLYALRSLREDTRIAFPVSFVEGGTMGLELVSYIAGASRLLVLDAVEADVPPGTVLRMQGEDLRVLPGSGNVHELALADIQNALRMQGEEPRETVLLGIQPDTTELGTSLSPRVNAALPTLVEAAIAELSRWAASFPPEPQDAGAIIKTCSTVSATES